VSDDVHVVFGTGQVGRTVANLLTSSGRDVRSISRHRPTGLAEGVDWRSVDLTDAEAAIDAAKGAPWWSTSASTFPTLGGPSCSPVCSAPP
jgi:nucleoside-diphosphate-sugar epimerase